MLTIAMKISPLQAFTFRGTLLKFTIYTRFLTTRTLFLITLLQTSDTFGAFYYENKL